MIPGPSLNEHHLVPRSRGGRAKWTIHVVCHAKIHSVFTEKELATEYHTWEALREHPEIKSFLSWVTKQDPEVTVRHARPRNRRKRG